MNRRVRANITTVSGSTMHGEIILHSGETLFKTFGADRNYIKWAGPNARIRRLPKSLIRHVRLLRTDRTPPYD
jgi:hypothetical protein